MSTDPYQILGIAKTASAADVRRAYRNLAKKYHPDLNPNDKGAEDKFKQISVANELLSNPEKRARFDRGEINIHGQEQAPPGFNYSQNGGPNGDSSFGDVDLNDLFGNMFSGGGRGHFQHGRRSMGQPGEDRRYSLSIDFLQAVNGGRSRVTLPDGAELSVKTPPAIEDGQILRLPGKGGPGSQGGQPGDAFITIHVLPHPHFKRDGRDIRANWPIDLKTAILGGKITVPTTQGNVSLTVPPHSDTGKVFRLQGRGMTAYNNQEAGNMYVTLQVTIGKVDPALEDFLRNSSDSQKNNAS